MLQVISSFAIATLFVSTPALARFERSTVEITSSKQSFDANAPWQKTSVTQETHLGVVVEQGILTTAYAVADANQLEVQLFDGSDRHLARVVFVDYEVNLALVDLVNQDIRKKLQPIQIGEELPNNARVGLLRARDRYQLKVFQGDLIELGVYSTPGSNYGVISYQLKVQQQGLGWSEPVVLGDALVGISTGQDRNFVHAVPATILKHFLADSLTPENYRGFPTTGISYRSLEDPNVRRLLKADKESGGVEIVRVTELGPFNGKMQPGDVLLAVNGKRLNDQGQYAHSEWGLIPFSYLINLASPGDEFTMTFLRDGQLQEAKAKLIRFDSNLRRIPYYEYDRKIPYLVYGGLVVQELSRKYLQLWGSDWEEIAPYPLLYQWHANDRPYSEPADRRFVILNRVLADKSTRGYDGIKNQLILAVNDQPVQSLADVKRLVSESPIVRDGRRYSKFTLAYDGGEIIVAVDGLQEVHERLAQSFQIDLAEGFLPPPAL